MNENKIIEMIRKRKSMVKHINEGRSLLVEHERQIKLELLSDKGVDFLKVDWNKLNQYINAG